MIIRRRNIASKLRHRLALEEIAHTPDGAGGYTRAWEEVAELWGEIIPISGQERLTGGQLQSPARCRIVLRHRGDITTAMRLKYEARIFNIRSIINTMERDHIIEILAEEGVA